GIPFQSKGVAPRDISLRLELNVSHKTVRSLHLVSDHIPIHRHIAVVESRKFPSQRVMRLRNAVLWLHQFFGDTRQDLPTHGLDIGYQPLRGIVAVEEAGTHLAVAYQFRGTVIGCTIRRLVTRLA